MSANPHRWTALLLLLLLSATAVATIYTVNVQRDDRQRRIEREVTVTTDSIARRLDAYGDVLASLRGLLRIDPSPSRADFTAFVGSLGVATRYPGVRSLSLARLHAGDHRAIVTRVAPAAGKEHLLGSDLSADRARSDALSATRASGMPAATAPRAEGRSGRGLALLLAIPGRDGRPGDVVSAALDADLLIRSTLGRRRDFDLELYDIGPVTAARPARAARSNLIFGDPGRLRAPRRTRESKALLRPLRIAGRRWLVYYAPRGATAAVGPNQWIVAIGGTLGSLLAAWLFLTLARGRSHALALAGRMTRWLEASERQMREIVETAHDAFIAIDERGVIIDWNPQAEATFGWSREEAVGRLLGDTIVPAAQREAHRRGIKRFLRTGEPHVVGRLIELTAVRRDGTEFPVELTISPLRTDSGHRFNAFVRDITQRTRTQEQLALAHAQAVGASRMKSDFVANMSHEIRTPLNGVIGLSGLLLGTELDEEQRDYAESIRASGDALMAVISDILDFSKIEAGKLELDDHPFELHEVVDGVSAMLAMEAHAKRLDLMVWVDDDVPSIVRGDAARIRQVLANLATNAIKFTHAGEVVMRVTVEPGGEQTTTVRFTVADTGIGIAPSAASRIFDAFSQADTSTTREYGGTGLGLAISKQLVELMGGRIGLESTPGAGSTFWFTVPVRVAERDEAAAAAPRRMGFGELRVIVVDDSATTRTILEHQLTSWGMRCETASDHESAMRQLLAAAEQGRPFALAIIDFNMPDADGLALVHAVQSARQLGSVRLVLLSSSGAEREAAAQAGVQGFVTKPVRASRLGQELSRVLGAGQLAPMVEAVRGPASASASPRAADGRRVLVAEDKSVNQLVAVRLLDKLGFRADIAANGREAVEMHADGDYEAVFMDCQMPELDGYQATVEIRRHEADGCHTPIIAMTAHTLRGDRERCLAAGMDDYIGKPIRTADLAEVIARALDGAPAQTPNPQRADVAHDDRPLLDEARLTEVFGDDDDGRAALLRHFVEQAAATIAELEPAIVDHDAAAVARLAHGLKGSAAVVGAERLSWIAARLSEDGAAGRLLEAAQLRVQLVSVLDSTIGALTPITGSEAR